MSRVSGENSADTAARKGRPYRPLPWWKWCVLLALLGALGWYGMTAVRRAGLRQPLIEAIKHGDSAAVIELLERGADPNAHDNGGKNPSLPQRLVELWDRMRGKGAKQQEGPSALLLASQGEAKSAILRALLQNGADARGKNGEQTLLKAVTANQPDLVHTLCAEGAGREAKDPESGATPLLLAVIWRQTPNIVELLAVKANVDAADSGGNTALIWAANRGDIALMQMLLKAGANIQIKNGEGQTALMKASLGYDSESVKLLLDHGADTRGKDKEGDTALMMAALKGQTESVRLLLASGADINAVDNELRNALIWAGQEGDTELIRLLLDRGADIHARDQQGKTALMTAILGGRREVVQLLVDRGADINAKDTEGSTALEYARQSAFPGLVPLLQKVQKAGTKE